jgi:hypothetical protein
MNSIEESLLRSRHAVGSETEKEREQRCRMHSVEKPPPMPPYSQEKKPTLEENEQTQKQERESSVSPTSINGEGAEKPNVFRR